MTEFIVTGSLAAIVIGFIYRYSQKIHSRVSIDSAIAKSEAEARAVDGYWLGKESRGFTENERHSAWKRAKKKCQHCGTMTVYGNVDNRAEYLKALVRGHSPSNAGHRVPRTHGGGFEKLGPVNLCRDCNSKESNDINDWVLREVLREDKKIFIG